MQLKEIFKNRKEPILNIYFTAGYPALESMPIILNSLEQAGVDMVEIGMPYSDPLSDGPTIQKSSAIALKNGISTSIIFEQLAKCESKIPKIMMGYFNAVLQFGVEKFCEKCQQNNIQGVILPDLPIPVYQEHYQTTFEKYGIAPIFLVTPETSEERIRYIDACSTAFIYAVSTSSTTGAGTGIQSAAAYLQKLQTMQLNNPILIGFNIGSKADFDFASQYAAGGIIGSAFIKQLENSTTLENDIQKFIKNIRPKN
ncbi:tryptophan synthase subunit alpha [Brumimicrobium salinarum]|uniref:Tryptophan synthase alpha chain n=1 Tax=Brumimicrobium salinarum TaxID=2058658 RepID=A0A2I0R5H2_9FLAO|nr:tryptophan synthase subunit alpha [Brumimicrobium salinarum]PKR81837.1 tryptophan synthase subunit alpha [Brumimicrobium salinarum]